MYTSLLSMVSRQRVLPLSWILLDCAVETADDSVAAEAPVKALASASATVTEVSFESRSTGLVKANAGRAVRNKRESATIVKIVVIWKGEVEG